MAVRAAAPGARRRADARGGVRRPGRTGGPTRDGVALGTAMPSRVGSEPAGDQRICIPEMAREMTSRWISEVPSKMV